MPWSHWLSVHVERKRSQSAMSGLVLAIFRGFSVYASSIIYLIPTYICAALSGQSHVCASTRLGLDAQSERGISKSSVEKCYANRYRN